MTDQAEDALELARLLGATQEAQRLGCRVLGSEHLLLAAMADPHVRRTFLGVGCGLREVQNLVAAPGRRLASGVVPVLTDEAAQALIRAAARVPALVPGRRPDPRVRSDAFNSLAVVLLTDEQNTAARRIFDELGLLGQTSHLAALIEQAGPRRMTDAERVMQAAWSTRSMGSLRSENQAPAT